MQKWEFLLCEQGLAAESLFTLPPIHFYNSVWQYTMQSDCRISVQCPSDSPELWNRMTPLNNPLHFYQIRQALDYIL